LAAAGGGDGGLNESAGGRLLGEDFTD